MIKLIITLGVSLLAALPVKSQDVRNANALGWQSQNRFTTAGIDINNPILTTWLMTHSGQVSNVNQLHLPAHQFQGYATAILAENKLKSEHLVVFGEKGIYKITDNNLSLMIESQSIHSNMLDTGTFKPLSYTFDINNDGLTDFILPDIDKHVLWLQDNSGQFTQFQLKVRLPTMLSEDEDQQHSFTLSYPIATKVSDVSGNGLNDIAIAFDEKIYFFNQYKQGEFSTEPSVLTAPFPFDTNMKKVQQSGRNESYFLQQLVDVNKDSILDLVVEKKTIERDKSESQTLEFYLGHRLEETRTLAFSLSASIELDGEMFSYGLSDFSGDGKPEFYYVSGELGASSVMSAFFGSGFEVGIKVHQQLAQGRFTRKPIKELSASFKLDVQNSVFGLFFKKLDVNNDGIVDVLLEQGDDGLVAYYGHKISPLGKRSKKQQVSLPNEPARLQNLTINNKNYLLSLDDVARFKQLNSVFH